MEIFELAAELGRTLKKDKRLVALEEARIAYEKDAHIAALMTEYEVQQKALENVAADKDFDPHMIEMIQDRINVLYDQITAHPTYKELEAAQEAVNEYMNVVNNTIMFAITGEMPSSCTHDCSTCGGGCH